MDLRLGNQHISAIKIKIVVTNKVKGFVKGGDKI